MPRMAHKLSNPKRAPKWGLSLHADGLIGRSVVAEETCDCRSAMGIDLVDNPPSEVEAGDVRLRPEGWELLPG